MRGRLERSGRALNLLAPTLATGGCVLLLLAVAGTTLVAQRGYATVDGTDFLRQTQSIFVGKLINKESFYSPDRRFIFTRHLFEVRETIKGTPTGRTEVIEYGGTVGDETMAVSHGPSYVLGQEYLVFSYVDLLKHSRTFAGALGQFQVVRDRQGKSLVRIYPSHPLVEVLSGTRAQTFQDLSTLSRQLRRMVQEVSREKK